MPSIQYIGEISILRLKHLKERRQVQQQRKIQGQHHLVSLFLDCQAVTEIHCSTMNRQACLSPNLQRHSWLIDKIPRTLRNTTSVPNAKENNKWRSVINSVRYVIPNDYRYAAIIDKLVCSF